MNTPNTTIKTAIGELSKHGKRFYASESGATSIEYGLMASMIGILAIAGMSKLGGSLNDSFTTVSKAFEPPAEGPTGGKD